MFGLRLSSFWNVEISWGVYRRCLFTDKEFLDCSAADCDFKKFFFVFSDCPYLLLISSVIFCVHFPFRLFSMSVVSVALFKPCSVSAFFEFLFFRCSLPAPTSSSYLDLAVFRDLCSSFVPGFALLWSLLYFSCLVVSMFIEGREKKKKLCSLLNVCLSLFITVGWCWATMHLPILVCAWIIPCGWKINAGKFPVINCGYL